MLPFGQKSSSLYVVYMMPLCIPRSQKITFNIGSRAAGVHIQNCQRTKSAARKEVTSFCPA